MKTVSFFLLLVAFTATVKAQVLLPTFYDVEEALLQGHEVQVVIDLTDGGKNEVFSTKDGIESKFDLFDATTVSLPLAPWNRLVYQDVVVNWFFSRSFITQDGKIGAYFIELTNFFGLVNAIVLEKVIDPLTFESLATADFGTQAVKFYDLTVESGTQVELLDFETIRAALLAGEGIVSLVVNTSACNPSELPAPIDKYDVTVGVPAIDRYYIVYPADGFGEELIATYASTISYDYGDFDLVYQRATNSYYIFPNGTVVLTAQALYGPDGPGIQGSYTTVCQLGEGARLWKNEKQEQEVLRSFEAVQAALSNGRQLRVVADERSCEEPSDPQMPVVAGYDVPSWELFIDPLFGPQQFLGFSQHTFLQGGLLLLDEIRLHQNDSLQVTFTYTDVASGNGAVVSQGVVKCELGENNFFITQDSPDKELLTTTSRIESEVLRGSTLQFVSPYKECRTPPGAEAVGGSPAKLIAVGEGVSISSHALISNYYTDEGLATNSVPLVIEPSGQAQFLPALYDADNWQNLFPPGYFYDCDLFDGSTGSIYVYKSS